jgi:two-component system, cell cycle response regulator
LNNELLNRILQSPQLPSLPTIALEVIDLVQQKDVDIKQIAETISHDPALSGKILKTVNSSFYGQSQEISTISHALVILGLNSIKTLALGFSLVDNLASKPTKRDDFDHLNFWKRSLYTAVASRTIAEKQRVVQKEEAFLAGLMQDLGHLAMAQVLDGEYSTIVLRASRGKDHKKLKSLEDDELGTNHAEIGAELAKTWNLPELLVVPILFHEDPTNAPEHLTELSRLVALGNRTADIFIFDNPEDSLAEYYRLTKQWFGIEQEDAEPLLAEIHKNTVEMGRLFDLPTGPLAMPQIIMASAHEAMFNISIQQTEQTKELERQNQSLLKKAQIDALTGIANRGTFDEHLKESFERTNSGEAGPLSLLFMDTDHFKLFNDQYGHQLGDKVLVEKARILTETSPNSALVTRYGGEEFAIIAPETSRVEAARLAEDIRIAIQNASIQSDTGEALKVTASVGVATFEGSFFQTPEQLIKAADKGVYAAKAAGRNCVRIFVQPKSDAA